MTYLDIEVDPACLQGTVAVIAPGSDMLGVMYPQNTEKAEEYYWSGVISTIEDLIELGATSFSLFMEPSVASVIGDYLLTETKAKLHCYVQCPELVECLTDGEQEVWSKAIQHFGLLPDMLKEATAVLFIQQPPQNPDVLDLATQCGATVIPCDPDVLIREIIGVDCFLRGLIEAAHSEP